MQKILSLVSPSLSTSLFSSFSFTQRRVSYHLTESSPDGFPKLGRWSIQYDERLIHRKIDQANEDHCGCCVNEFKKVEQVDLNEEKNEKDEEKEQEKYLIPYCM